MTTQALTKNMYGQFTPIYFSKFLGQTANGVCRCCKREITGRGPNCLLCKTCYPYIKGLVNKYNKRINRSERFLKGFLKIGRLGRVRQMINWNKQTHKIINRLKSQVRYYKNANKRDV